MGVSCLRIQEGETDAEAPKISLKIANQVSKAICKIIYENNRGTGFFININDDLKCIATCYHVISKDIINNSIIIEIHNKKRIEIELKERYIESFENLDITIIEVKDSDILRNEDIDFLNCESDYSQGYKQFKESYIFTLQYPGNDIDIASGKIKKINNYEFAHNIHTDNGSSGSPIILASSIKVIGIHNSRDMEDKINYATFIGEIFKIKNFIKKKEKNNIRNKISSDVINKVDKSICMIIYKKKNEEKNGTGFFILLNNIKYLVTSFKIIGKNIINDSIYIKIYNKIEIKIELKERNIKFLEDLDITILEIKESDEIIKYIDFLTYDLNYTEGYNQYKDIDVLIFQYIKDKIEVGSGKIIDILSNSEFKYNININNASFGYPILLPNTLKVIGISKQCYINDNKIYYGTFIGEIFKNNRLNINENNFKYIQNQNVDNNNIKIEHNENINKPPNNINCIIDGVIYISEDNINKDIRIINSYEEMCREYNLEIKEEYRNEEEIKECIIEIDGKILPEFSYFYKFKNQKDFIIKYTFKNILTNLNCMFCNCSNITALILSNFDTGNAKNMIGMFSNCISLLDLDLSNCNFQNVQNMDGIFYNCLSLTDLDLSNCNIHNIIEMGWMFLGCSRLENLNLSNFNTCKVQNMASLFKNCSSLKSLSIQIFDTQNVKNMSEMFYNCSSLKTIDISNFNTQNVENMSNMFWKCSSLEDLNLSNFNIQNVKDMSGMFSRCSSLKSLNLSSFRGSDNLKDMNGMFSHCISLINLDLSNCDTKNVENIKDIFAGCSSLKNLNISNFNTNKVKNIDGIFRNCKELNINSIKTKDLRILNIMKYDYSNLIGIEDKLNYNNSLNKIGYNKNDDNNNNYIIGELYISRKDINKNMRIISSYEEMCRKFGSEIKEQYKNEKEIKECIIEIDGKKLQPFSYYHKFKSEGNYTIIYYFKNILSSCSSLFSECSCLTYLDLSNFNTKNSIYMDSMFYGCNSLKNVDLSNLNTVKVIDMHSMFQNCSSLINLDLSNLNTENVTNIHSMFAGCSSLTHLDLSNFNLKQKVKDFRDVASLLMGCNSLNINGIVTNEPNILNEIVLGQLFKTATNPTNCGIF